jgi:predicted transcriptional regulator
MAAVVRENFSAPVDAEVLAALRQVARSQGRPVETLLEEALRQYIERQQGGSLRTHVMEAFASSIEEYDPLYRELAK